MFSNIDLEERKHFPAIDRQKPVNEEIILELYNRYLLLTGELDNYKHKIIYFLQAEDDQEPEFLLEQRNISFNERISKIEGWKAMHQVEYEKIVERNAALQLRIDRADSEIEGL